MLLVRTFNLQCTKLHEPLLRWQRRKQTFLEALDFAEVRSYEDAKLLSDARFGARGADGKMSREQYKCERP